MSLDGFGGTWQKLSLPPGIKATPLWAGDVLALVIKGKTIDHIAAFSASSGKWSKQHLLTPVEDEIHPAIGPGCALYQSENDFYAFSSMQGKWGVLHLEGDEKPRAEITPNSIRVLQGNKLYVFALRVGESVYGRCHELAAVPVRCSRSGAGEMSRRGVSKLWIPTSSGWP